MTTLTIPLRLSHPLTGPRPAPAWQGFLPGLRRDPLAFLTAAAREHGDLVPFQFGPRRFFLLSHPDLIEDVLVTRNRLFQKDFALRQMKRLLGNGLLINEGDAWRRQRRLAQPAFHRDRINAYAETMTAFTDRHLAGWRAGETRDVHQEMMTLTLAIVAKTLFDTEAAHDAELVGGAVEAAMRHFQRRRQTAFMMPDWFPTPESLAYRQRLTKLDAYLLRLINLRRASGADHGDLLSMLLAARDDDESQMTDQQLLDETKTIFLAGHETTANALTWTWWLLSQNPAAEARLHAELEAALAGRLPTLADLPHLPYTTHVVAESLRLYPPAWNIPREAVQACEIAGVPVRPGDTLFMSQWVVHRDPRFYDQPEAFLPERWEGDLLKRLPTYAYFPFGGGPRMCIGNRFAQMEAVLLVAAIAQRFQLVVAPGERPEPEPSITLRPRTGLRVTLRARAR